MMLRSEGEEASMGRTKRAVRCVMMSIVIAFGAMAERSAWSETYPDRLIKVILPYSPGSGADVVTRLAMEKLSTVLKQSIVIENRPGSAGIAGTVAAANSPPDGYNLVTIATQQAITPSLYKKLPYDILQDFSPVARLTLHPLVLAVPASLPVNSVPELVAYAKQRPGELNYGSTGVGTAIHLAGAFFTRVADFNATHIAYTTTSDALVALSRGDIQFMFYGHEALAGVIQSGQVKLLASTGDSRPSWGQDFPTVKETGFPTYSIYAWHGVLAPKRTPKEAIDVLDAAVAQVLADPTLRKKYEDAGVSPNYLDDDDFGKFLAAEIARYGEIVKLAGLQPN
jgi:tripartite-type tricarboxylate transporter receptor subunit TctC